jgi:hypothetical protein
MFWQEFLKLMNIEDWVSNTLMLISVLVTGIFSWLVWRVSKISANVAKSTYQLVMQNEDKKELILKNEKTTYTILILQKLSKYKQLLVDRNMIQFMIEMKEGIPFKHDFVSRYYDHEFGIKLFLLWDQIDSLSNILVLRDLGSGDFGVEVRGDDVNERIEDIIFKLNSFINSILGVKFQNERGE